LWAKGHHVSSLRLAHFTKKKITAKPIDSARKLDSKEPDPNTDYILENKKKKKKKKNKTNREVEDLNAKASGVRWNWRSTVDARGIAASF